MSIDQGKSHMLSITVCLERDLFSNDPPDPQGKSYKAFPKKKGEFKVS